MMVDSFNPRIKHINMTQIPVYKPYLSKRTLNYAKDALDSSWVSSHGKYLIKAEDKLKEISESKFVLLTNNGTSATHLVAHALKMKYPDIDTILVPSNVYVAAWNMFRTIPYYDFYPLDADLNTWNMDLNKVPNLNLPFYQGNIALLVVPNLGNPIDLSEFKKKYPYVPIVIDNCEGFLGSKINSLASSVSFFGNKTLTSGEGGAFFTDDEDVYKEMDRIRCQGLTKEKFIFDGIGYNYRMTNIQAALLYGQLEDKDEILEKKEEIFNTYKENLKSYNIHFQTVQDGLKHSNWMFGIRFDLPKEDVKRISDNLLKNGIETRPMFPPMYYHSHFKEYDYFPISQQLYEQVLILPSYPELTKEQVIFISNLIKKEL